MQYCPDIYEVQILLWQCRLESLDMYLVTSQKNVIPKIAAVMTLQSGGKLVIYFSSPLLSLTHLQPNSDSGEEWYSGIAAAIHNSTNCNKPSLTLTLSFFPSFDLETGSDAREKGKKDFYDRN